jgi:hypothetical protein
VEPASQERRKPIWLISIRYHRSSLCSLVLALLSFSGSFRVQFLDTRAKPWLLIIICMSLWQGTLEVEPGNTNRKHTAKTNTPSWWRNIQNLQKEDTQG